jgi:cell wall-associated NlpC family hydrolase
VSYQDVSTAIRYAWSLIGSRYYWTDGSKQSAGNDDPVLGFDCSGFVSEICRAVGWIGSRERLSSTEFLARFPRSTGSRPKPGDILIYGGRLDDGTLDPYHVSFVVGPEHIIEAGGGGRGVDTDGEAAALNAFVRVRPIEFRASEIIACVTPGGAR